jgi:hypothetical protein
VLCTLRCSLGAHFGSFPSRSRVFAFAGVGRAGKETAKKELGNAHHEGEARGGRALAVPTDVADEGVVEELARHRALRPDRRVGEQRWCGVLFALRGGAVRGV